MYTALKFARAHREQRLEKARQLEKEKLERKLNKLKVKLEKEIREHQRQLRKVSGAPAAEIAIPIPEQGPSTSSSAIKFGFPGQGSCRIHYAKPEKSDSEDDEDEFGHVHLASVSGTTPEAAARSAVHNLHFLSVSPMAGGSVASSCSNLSQVNISSPVFCARSVSASMKAQDRTRGSLTYSDCSGALDLNGRWKEAPAISTISGNRVKDDNETDAKTKKKSILLKFLNLKPPKLDPSQTRLTANMIGTFIILAGFLAAILGFLANEDFNHVAPAIMAIGFVMVMVGFVIIFLGEVAILLYSNVLTKFLALIGNNKHGVIAPKLEADPEAEAGRSGQDKLTTM